MDREASLLRRPQWVLHTIVGEIEYPQRVKGGLRHASLMGIRPDKRPRLIRRSPLLSCRALPRDRPVEVGRAGDIVVLRSGPWTVWLATEAVLSVLGMKLSLSGGPLVAQIIVLTMPAASHLAIHFRDDRRREHGAPAQGPGLEGEIDIFAVCVEDRVKGGHAKASLYVCEEGAAQDRTGSVGFERRLPGDAAVSKPQDMQAAIERILTDGGFGAYTVHFDAIGEDGRVVRATAVPSNGLVTIFPEGFNGSADVQAGLSTMLHQFVANGLTDYDRGF